MLKEKMEYKLVEEMINKIEKPAKEKEEEKELHCKSCRDIIEEEICCSTCGMPTVKIK